MKRKTMDDNIALLLIGFAIGFLTKSLSSKKKKKKKKKQYGKSKYCKKCRDLAAEGSEYCKEHWFYETH